MSTKIDPMKGVVKSEELSKSLRLLQNREHGARSYVRGALMYLTRKPPNPYIVPLLSYALRKYA